MSFANIIYWKGTVVIENSFEIPRFGWVAT